MNPKEDLLKSNFFHIRIDSNGKIYEYEKNQIISSKGGYTFCYWPMPVYQLQWGVSKCHETDNYNKYIGRIKSKGRSFSKEFGFKTKFMEVSEAKKFAYGVAKLLNEAKSSGVSISKNNVISPK